MNYIEYNIKINPNTSNNSEIVIARLADAGFESFVENETGILAYIGEKHLNQSFIEELLRQDWNSFSISYSYQLIKDQNWNAVWESNFEPIFIKDEIAVRAPFHDVNKNYHYQIVIEPKMSFGTGHHETTSLMMETMLQMDFSNKSVLDMGSGTGILGILAEMLGAKDVTAIDIEDWAFENCKENIARNNCRKIEVLHGDKHSIPQKKFNLILANINRNVLLEDIQSYSDAISNKGLLLLSGFYSEDIELIKNKALEYNFIFTSNKLKKNWAACLFEKK